MAARGFQAAYWKGKHCIHLGAYPAADLLLDLEYMRLELGILRLGVIIGWKEASSNRKFKQLLYFKNCPQFPSFM